jgi:glycosyltransferase involved in cell wall biosynthesis
MLHRRTRLIVWVQMTEHQQEGHRPIRTFVRKLILQFADAVIANGRSARRYIAGLGFPEAQVFVALGSIEMGSFLALPEKAQVSAARRLLYVGRLVEGKGILQFLSRLASFARGNPSTQLVFEFAGYGPLEAAIKSAEHPPNMQVRYRGAVLHEELPQIYASGDIFVFPTLSDEWGQVINEAMASGLPVLGSVYSQAVEEMVEDTVSGWTFAPDRQDEVDKAIASAVNASDDDILAMGRNARTAVQHNTPTRSADEMFRAVEAVL